MLSAPVPPRISWSDSVPIRVSPVSEPWIGVESRHQELIEVRRCRLRGGEDSAEHKNPTHRKSIQTLLIDFRLVKENQNHTQEQCDTKNT